MNDEQLLEQLKAQIKAELLAELKAEMQAESETKEPVKRTRRKKVTTEVPTAEPTTEEPLITLEELHAAFSSPETPRDKQIILSTVAWSDHHKAYTPSAPRLRSLGLSAVGIFYPVTPDDLPDCISFDGTGKACFLKFLETGRLHGPKSLFAGTDDTPKHEPVTEAQAIFAVIEGLKGKLTPYLARITNASGLLSTGGEKGKHYKAIKAVLEGKLIRANTISFSEVLGIPKLLTIEEVREAFRARNCTKRQSQIILALCSQDAKGNYYTNTSRMLSVCHVYEKLSPQQYPRVFLEKVMKTRLAIENFDGETLIKPLSQG